MRRFLDWLRALLGTRRRPAPVPKPEEPAKPPTPAPTPPKPVEPTPAPPAVPPVVTPPPLPGSTEPIFVPGAHRVLHMDDFSGPDPIAKYSRMDNERGLSIEAGAGVNGSDALRIDWLPKAGCTDDGHLIEKAWPDPPKELVISWTVRYSPGFIFDWAGRSPCSGNAKKLAFLWGGASGRFMVISENHRIGCGSDADHPLFAPTVGPELTPEQLGDGAYHRLTFHVRQSTTAETTDGEIHGWVDGVKRWQKLGIPSHASGGWQLFKMPTTFNQGSPVKQSEWLDSVRVWVP